MHLEKPDVSYIVDETNSHKKSKEERALVIKCDLVIVPLGALLYFVAYLVCLPLLIAFKQNILT